MTHKTSFFLGLCFGALLSLYLCLPGDPKEVMPLKEQKELTSVPKKEGEVLSKSPPPEFQAFEVSMTVFTPSPEGKNFVEEEITKICKMADLHPKVKKVEIKSVSGLYLENGILQREPLFGTEGQ